MNSNVISGIVRFLIYKCQKDILVASEVMDNNLSNLWSDCLVLERTMWTDLLDLMLKKTHTGIHLRSMWESEYQLHESPLIRNSTVFGAKISLTQRLLRSTMATHLEYYENVKALDLKPDPDFDPRPPSPVGLGEGRARLCAPPQKAQE